MNELVVQEFEFTGDPSDRISSVIEWVLALDMLLLNATK